MVFNTTYRNDDITERINGLVGEPYSFWERVKIGGIGSMRMIVEDAHLTLQPYLKTAPQITYANIELRPKGILIHLNNVLKIYTWVIPFQQLVIKQEMMLSIYHQRLFLTFRDAYVHNEKFLQKIIALKSKSTSFQKNNRS